jgi:thiol-disulfide isomerase/thioredoxin
MLDGKSFPVYFTADSSVFNDTAFPNQTISYTDLSGIRQNFTNSIELTNNETIKAVIHQPTFFYRTDPFLVFPNEHISIKKGFYNDYSFEIPNNTQRNKELQFFSTFNKLYNYPIFRYKNNASLDSILTLEENAKNKIPDFKKAYQHLFDSLINSHDLSSSFKHIAKDYVAYKFTDYLFANVYKVYKDTLQAHHLFKEKCKLLIPSYNEITDKVKFAYTITSLNEIAEIVLPYRIWKIKNDAEFKACYDSIETNFKAVAKDYLLSQLMYFAYKKQIKIPDFYSTNYETACNDAGYKHIIHNIAKEQKLNDEKSKDLSGNALLRVNGKKSKNLDELLSQYKGKLVLIDFWASWCSPCLEEMPYLKKNIQAFKSDDIVFISISLDKEIQPWRKKVIALNLDQENAFLMINANQSSFIQANDINEIPRFMLFGKDGKLIKPNAPRPSNSELNTLINHYLAL